MTHSMAAGCSVGPLDGSSRRAHLRGPAVMGTSTPLATAGGPMARPLRWHSQAAAHVHQQKLVDGGAFLPRALGQGPVHGSGHAEEELPVVLPPLLHGAGGQERFRNLPAILNGYRSSCLRVAIVICVLLVGDISLITRRQFQPLAHLRGPHHRPALRYSVSNISQAISTRGRVPSRRASRALRVPRCAGANRLRGHHANGAARPLYREPGALCV